MPIGTRLRFVKRNKNKILSNDKVALDDAIRNELTLWIAQSTITTSPGFSCHAFFVVLDLESGKSVRIEHWKDENAWRVVEGDAAIIWEIMDRDYKLE